MTATIKATDTALPTPTSGSTATPIPIPTFTPTLTPTNVPTPLPGSGVLLSAENAPAVQQLAVWGRGRVESVRYADESQALLVSTPLGLYVYRAESLEDVLYLEGVQDFWLSPDTRLLCAHLLGEDTVQIWDIRRGELTATLPHEAVPIYTGEDEFFFDLFESDAALSYTFTPDGSLMATAYADYQIAVWSTDTWELIKLLSSNLGSYVSSMSFSPDNEYLATSGGTLNVWRMGDGELISRVPNAGTISPNPFSPDGEMLASSDFGAVLVWSFPGAELLYSYPVSGYPDVEFSTDSRYLILDGSVARAVKDGSRPRPDIETKILNPEEENNKSPQVQVARREDYMGRLESKGHFSWIQGAIFEDRSMVDLPARLLAWGNLEQDFVSWDVFSDHVERVVLPDEPSNRAALSTTRRTLAYCSPSGVLLLDWSTSRQPISGVCKESGRLAFSMDDRVIFRAAGRLINWIDLPSGQVTHDISSHANIVTALAVSPDGRLLASGSEVTRGGAELFLWKLDPLSIWQRWKITAYYGNAAIESLVFSPDSTLLAVGGADQNIKLMRVSDGWQLKILHTEFRALHLAFSPDGRMLAAADMSGKVFIWSIPDGEEVVVLDGHAGRVLWAEFVQGGARLLTASDDGTLRLWGLP